MCPRSWGPLRVVPGSLGRLVAVRILEYAPISGDIPLRRREDPFGDPDVAEIFVVLDDGKTGVVVTLQEDLCQLGTFNSAVIRPTYREVCDDVPFSLWLASTDVDVR